MWCSVLTVFPQMFNAMRDFGITARAIEKGLLTFQTFDLRDFAHDNYATVDDRPYGGGPGMVLMAKPIREALQEMKKNAPSPAKVIYVSPAGKPFDAKVAREMAEEGVPLIFIAGRYEGIDSRVIEHDVDEVYSVGDYVLSGGELPVMVMIDAMTRWLEGALGHEDSAANDAFSEENHGLLDCPHYTRPAILADQKVPAVLLSGDHQAIARWRKKQALGQTWLHRPDLLGKRPLDALQQQLLAEFKEEFLESK